MRRATTSDVLRRIANQFRAGRHPLVTGLVGDLVLLQGETIRLPEAVERLASSSFDVVLRVDAADGLCVVKGAEQMEQLVVPHDDGRAGQAGEPTTTLRAALAQSDFSVCTIVDQAGIFLQDPAFHDQPDRGRVATLQLALREAAQHGGGYRNTCVLLASDVRGIPAVLLAGSDDVALIEAPAPSAAERGAVLSSLLPEMSDADRLEDDAARDATVDQLCALTDGDSMRTLVSLGAYSAQSRRSVLDPRALVAHHRLGDRPDHWGHLDMDACQRTLEESVFGQDVAVDAVMGVLAAGRLGLDFSGDAFAAERPPRGILFFLGPTGVGKNTMAKALAEAVFADPEAYVAFDMATFAQEHAAERLTGAPPGYVGFGEGGELTNALIRRPNSVVLLDEIEKAHPRVLDRFLSIFDSGRITDGQGRVTYFGDAIFVATSNIGSDALARLVAEQGENVSYDAVRSTAIASMRAFCERIDRPEFFGRIEPGVVAFDILRDEALARIVRHLVATVAFRNGPRLDIDEPSAIAMARSILADPDQSSLGGRQVRNVLQRHLRQLAVWLATGDRAAAEVVHVRFADDAMFASVDGGAEELVRGRRQRADS
ncbi:MAG: AAA family ATPase [Acidimicrobiales bacterium]|nr:AAA family ATPase [Acidimicrobiales bacterium]